MPHARTYRALLLTDSERPQDHLRGEGNNLPYTLHPVNIGASDQFGPEFTAIAPDNRMPAITGPASSDGKPIARVRIRCDPANLARKTGQFGDRPALIEGRAVGADLRKDLTTDRKAQEILFKR